jgi:hypothetical protein
VAHPAQRPTREKAAGLCLEQLTVPLCLRTQSPARLWPARRTAQYNTLVAYLTFGSVPVLMTMIDGIAALSPGYLPSL